MAQLGARFHGMEEVKGSNPFRSTKISQEPAFSAQLTTFIRGVAVQMRRTGGCSSPLANQLDSSPNCRASRFFAALSRSTVALVTKVVNAPQMEFRGAQEYRQANFIKHPQSRYTRYRTCIGAIR